MSDRGGEPAFEIEEEEDAGGEGGLGEGGGGLGGGWAEGTGSGTVLWERRARGLLGGQGCGVQEGESEEDVLPEHGGMVAARAWLLRPWKPW